MRITLTWALNCGSKILQLLILTVHNGNTLERIRAFNFTMCILLCVVEDESRELLLLWAMYLISLYSIQFLNLKPLCVCVCMGNYLYVLFSHYFAQHSILYSFCMYYYQLFMGDLLLNHSYE